LSEPTPITTSPVIIEKATAKPARKIFPYLALGAGILSLSMSAMFVKWADAPGVITSFYRMTLAAVMMLPFFWRYVAVKPARPLSTKWLFLPILSGLFNSLDHAVWSTAMGYTSVANAALLNNISPLWVALFAFFIWKERLNKSFWIGLVLALSGAVIIFGNDAFSNPHLGFGDLLATASSFFYAGYYLVTQRGRNFYSVLPYWWVVTTCSSAFLLFYVFIFNIPLAGYSGSTYLTFILAALISQMIGSFSLTYALGHLPASVVAPTMIVQPVLSALLAIPLAGESLLPLQWLGGAVVLAGIYWVNRR
jgi:drug/metabolite transporter (DMT)-like permease